MKPKRTDKKIEVIGYMWVGENWNENEVSRFLYRKRPSDKSTFKKVRITQVVSNKKTK